MPSVATSAFAVHHTKFGQLILTKIIKSIGGSVV